MGVRTGGKNFNTNEYSRGGLINAMNTTVSTLGVQGGLGTTARRWLARRTAGLSAGHDWTQRSAQYAESLGRGGFSEFEMSLEFDGDPRWNECRPSAANKAAQAVDAAFARGKRAACAFAVQRWLDHNGYERGDVVYHADGLCISGAQAADVEADELRDVVLEVAADRGVAIDVGDFEFECREATAVEWMRPTFRPWVPPPNPADLAARALFEGWHA